MLAKTFVLSLLASMPLVAALQGGAGEVGLQKREYTGSIAARAIAELPKRHHTEAQIAAKKAAAAKKAGNKRQEADEFGPWDAEEDEFGSWVDKREADPEAHHTEAQIAAKQAAAAAKGSSSSSTNCKRDPEAHHTEAQIAAKQAAANGGC